MKISALNATLRKPPDAGRDPEVVAVEQVSRLDSMEIAELLVSMTKQLSEQKAENDLLKSAADRANQSMTIWKLITTVVAVVLAMGAGVLWVGGEWAAWTEIKSIHSGMTTSGRTTYDHSTISGDFLKYGDIVLLRNPDGLLEGRDVFPSEKDFMFSNDATSTYVRWTLERPN